MTIDRRHGTWWQNWQGPDNQPAAVPTPAFGSRFVRFFDLPGQTYPAGALAELGTAMTAKHEEPPTKETDQDPEENRGTAADPGIPAAYTYFGQFIDHDLTLDPTSNLHGSPLTDAELAGLVNFRTPRLDLDCLYGRGPSDQPYLYAADGLHLLPGTPMSGNPHDHHTFDVPRAPNGRALIGDPRNDENRIVAQLQATMIRFHNRLVDTAKHRADHGGPTVTLADVQNQVRWHYQWVIVHDFLPTIIQPEVLAAVFPGRTDDPGTTDDAPTFKIKYLTDAQANGAEPLLPMMPVEFSVAAYRFGHSMIRPIYRINQTVERRQIFADGRDAAGDLGGMRPIPTDWALDWQYFIDIDHHGHHSEPGNDQLIRRPQFSYKIDTSLVNPLAKLSQLVAMDPRSLPERNLLRGQAFSLPSGEDVAHALDVPVLKPQDILIGKATGDARDPRQPISALAGGVFEDKTPLWTYILAEAWATSWAQRAEGTADVDVTVRLGPVGGHLVAETIGAFLLGDTGSYLGQAAFRPDPDLTHNGAFGLAELINAAIGR